MIYKDQEAAQKAADALNAVPGFPFAKAINTASGWTVVRSYAFKPGSKVPPAEIMKKYSIEVEIGTGDDAYWVPIAIVPDGPNHTDEFAAALRALQARESARPDSRYRMVEWVGTVILPK